VRVGSSCAASRSAIPIHGHAASGALALHAKAASVGQPRDDAFHADFLARYSLVTGAT
jgi:hypothetical protein